MKMTNVKSEYFYIRNEAEEFIEELKEDGIEGTLIQGGDGWYVEWTEGNQKREDFGYFEYFYLLEEAKEFIEELKEDGIEGKLVKGGDGWYVEWKEA